MAVISTISLCFLALLALHSSSFPNPLAGASESESKSKEFVISLDHSNFTDVVSKLDFIIVSFYNRGCGHCKALAPEYEKAASILSRHDPPLTLAKVYIVDPANTGLAGSDGNISIKIVREGGKIVQEYKGPYDAEGIVKYVKRQYGPPSVEINNLEDAQNFISDKKIVGIFPQFSGEEFKNYTLLAEKLHHAEEFFHTLDAKLLPRGESSVTGPLIRLFKPFDELFVDAQDFDVDAMEKFIEKSSVPMITILNGDNNNKRFVDKFSRSTNPKVMLYINFSSDNADSFNYEYREVAKQYREHNLDFLMGDIEASPQTLEFFGVKGDKVPFLIVTNNDGTKYLKTNVEPDQISPWVENYKNGELQPYIKSEPIPEHNDEPVKVVVAHSFQDIVFNSGKNVLLEFYAPWSKKCKELAPILEEVAISYKSDPDVIVAKFDGSANDFPRNDDFQIGGYPAVVFKSASGNILEFSGYATKKNFIDFIEQNRREAADKDPKPKDEL